MRSALTPGPFARWPRTIDLLLALVLFVAAIFVVETPDGLVLRGADDILLAEAGFAAVASGALYWRRSRPLEVMTVAVIAAALAFWLVDFDIAGIAVVSVYAVGRYVGNDVAGHVGAAVVATLVVLVGWLGDSPSDLVWAGLFFTLLVYFVGTRLRLRELRARQSQRHREEEARRLVAEERTRIARELHDVVAHHVSVMTVQAGAARTVADDDPEAARAAMGAVETAGREVLGELRDLLDVLRPQAPDTGPVPELRLTDLARVIDQMRAAGVETELDMEIDSVLPARVDLFAFRIIQEALTNVLKHAGRGATAVVSIRLADHNLAIEVTDDGVGGKPRWGAGHGLIGMRERAQLLGGTLDAGSGPMGGFTVSAVLPVDEGRL